MPYIRGKQNIEERYRLIDKLYDQGLPQNYIAKHVGLHPSTVNEYLMKKRREANQDVIQSG